MKAILLFFTLFNFFLIDGYSQKCKYDYEEKDPFTGKYKVGITATISKSWKIGFNREDDNYSIGLVISFPGVKEDIIRENDTLMIAIENGEPLCFNASAEALPVSNVVGSGAYSPAHRSMLAAKAKSETSFILTGSFKLPYNFDEDAIFAEPRFESFYGELGSRTAPNL